MGAFRELRDRVTHRHDPMRCQEAVELVTDYLEGVMTRTDAERFERHLAGCPDCVRYVEQARRTVDTLGRAHPLPPDRTTRAALIDAFRDFQQR